MAYVVRDDSYLAHYGTPHDGATPHSGRYEWGSGEDGEQRPEFFNDVVRRMYKDNPGITQAEVAAMLNMTQSEMRQRITAASAEKKQYQRRMVLKRDKQGASQSAIAKELGISPGTVRNILNPVYKDRYKAVSNTADMLRKAIKEQGAVDIGAGVDIQMGVSEAKFKGAVKQLMDEGYNRWYIPVEQMGTGMKTNTKVLADPELGKSYFGELSKDPSKIGMVTPYSKDGGMTYDEMTEATKKRPPSLSSDRLQVAYNKDKDGVIELRPGVEDISLGNAHYAQVRISVDDTHYLKGMAVYNNDLPDGIDVRFNTSKPEGTPVFGPTKDNSVLKPCKDGVNPYGAVVKRTNGVVNIVNEEGYWRDNWSLKLASQFLSKQTVSLAETQLKKTFADKKKQYDEIMSLENDAVKYKMLESFSDQLDSDAVHLKAAAMPRQSWNVILPCTTLAPNEVYAPNYDNGETLVLVRYPHAGRFEIPQLIVNNKNPEGKRIIGNAKDAIGIHPSVAAILSGADFDGDTVMTIPNNDGRIKTAPPLDGLKNFDHHEMFKAYPGMPKVGPESGFREQIEMGKITNLITDMTLLGASTDKIERAVKHSMVIIDAEKHNLDWRASEKEFRIKELKDEFQGGGGVATLVSRAKNQKQVPLRKAGVMVIDPVTGAKRKQYIDPETGDKLYEYTGETKRVQRTIDGEKKWVDSNQLKTFESTRMAEAKDARELSSGHPMDEAYAKYANDLKDLARKARLEMLKIDTTPPVNKQAREEYKEDVKDLMAQLKDAKSNAPLERRAQAIAGAWARAERDAEQGMSYNEYKKVKAKCLVKARNMVGAGKKKITISDRQWEAIQNNALSFTAMQQIFANTDSEKLVERALPKTFAGLTTAQLSKAKTLISNGATRSEVADALGVSVSTIARALEPPISAA